ncbi:DUF1772 domain-containing protein [Amycolatopsis anabasis]|uniref:DUF1772 domain-containing protein n=1 Tax=Amycolatopsis anabasis TaxID=1840409 RepID=UPI001C551183|nr:DUF1772 domain-containing protein [Amycolatopsis anabasis]
MDHEKATGLSAVDRPVDSAVHRARPWRNSVLWLFPLALLVGVQFGAGLYEKIILVPRWSSLPGDRVVAAIEDVGMKAAGREFWPFVSPAVGVLAILNLVLAWRSTNANRSWWLAGAALMAGYAIFSYGFFVPQMLMLQADGGTWPADRIETVVDWWTGLNYLRMVIGGAGWLCVLRALSMSSAARAR